MEEENKEVKVEVLPLRRNIAAKITEIAFLLDVEERKIRVILYKTFGERIGKDIFTEAHAADVSYIHWVQENGLLEEFDKFINKYYYPIVDLKFGLGHMEHFED